MNLDTFNSGYAALDNDQERAEFVSGLYKGMNGGKVKDDCSDPMSVGFAIGEEMRKEAEGFRERSVENGAKRKSNRNDQTVDHEVYQTVDLTCTQSTIHNPQSTIQQPEKASSPSRARGPRKPKKQIHIPEEYLKDLQVICDDWPRRSKKQEGGYQDLRIWTDPADLWEAMTKNFPNDDPALMIKCGLVYLDQILPEPNEFDLRDSEPPSFCYAMMNFYGPKMAYWKLKKEAARAKMEEQK